MKKLIIFIQVSLLRLTLESAGWANKLGSFCLGLVGLGAGLEDLLSGIHIYKNITAQHIVIGGGSAGAALSRFSIKHPEKLQSMIAALEKTAPEVKK